MEGGSINPALIALLVFVIALVIYLIAGFRRIPLGAVGLVVTMGRRTGDVRSEGNTWLARFFQSVVVLFIRERQVDIPTAQYYTSDRVRIAFKTTIRVSVADAAALFSQGPGTYGPFTREGYGNTESGSEEANIALRNLVQNSIRETIQAMRIDEVMFGGSSQNSVRELIRQALARTAKRWGLEVLEVWLTDVDADNAEVKKAVQAEVQATMEGRGQLAKFEVKVAQGGLFQKVAMDVANLIYDRTGNRVSPDQVMNFLIGFYRNERALDVAMAASKGTNDILQAFYMHHVGMPLPDAPPVLPGLQNAPGAGLFLGGSPGIPFLQGSWIIGREGTIEIDSPGVSRRHARLDGNGSQYTLTDLGSSNGTFVNNAMLTPNSPILVQPSDSVRFGQRVSTTVASLVQAVGRGRLDVQPG